MSNSHSRKKQPWPFVFVITAVMLAAITLYVRVTKSPPTARDASIDGVGGSTPPGEARKNVVRPGAFQTSMPVDTRQAIQQAIASRAQRMSEQARLSATNKALAATAYAVEKRDPVWAKQKEQSLQAVVNGPGMSTTDINPRGLSMDCRQTICRMQASFANSGDANDWVMLYMSSVGSTLQKSMVSKSTNYDGSVNVEILSKAR